MELQTLVDKRAELERLFNIAQQKKNQADQESNEYAEEMAKLQGGYRTLTELIDQQDAQPSVYVEGEPVPKKEKK